MKEQSRGEDQNKSKPRHISEVTQGELDVLCTIHGWRIWKSTLFDNEAFSEALEEAGSKPNALVIGSSEPQHNFLHNRYEEIQRKLRRRPRMPFGAQGSFDLPTYVLEPLTEDEVKLIDDQGENHGPLGSIDRPEEIIRPQELTQILNLQS